MRVLYVHTYPKSQCTRKNRIRYRKKVIDINDPLNRECILNKV